MSEMVPPGAGSDEVGDVLPYSDRQPSLATRWREPTCLQAYGIAAQLPHISVDLARALVCIINSSLRALSDPAR